MIKNLAIGGGVNKGFLALALVLGILSAVLIGVFLSSADKGSSGGATSAATVPVVVAAQDIPAFTRVTETMVTVREVPVDLALAGVFGSAEDVTGQVTQVQVLTGEQVVPAKVTATGVNIPVGGSAPASFLIPEGKRAFSIALSSVGSAGGLVRAGDYIDILVSGAKTAEGSQELLTPGASCYMLQDIEVLAIGTTLKSAGAGAGDAVAGAETNTGAKSATLAVTPEEASWLAGAQQSVNGDGVGNQLWVALRPFGEHGQNADLPACGVVPGF